MKYSEFGTDPCRAIFSGVTTMPVLGRIPNANVSIERLAGQFRAHTELPVPVRFNPRTLASFDPDMALPMGRMGTAHPHRDPATGERFSYEIELIPPCESSASAAAPAASLPSSPRSDPATCTRSG
jgi:hypothetical protein